MCSPGTTGVVKVIQDRPAPNALRFPVRVRKPTERFY